MSVQIAKKHKGKIGPEFLNRLNRLDPEQKIRIIVMLFIGGKKTRNKRLTHAKRSEKMKDILKLSQKAIFEIDHTLEKYGGQKLASKPNALGSLPIEITVSGVNALASLKEVKAIMEDQPISLIVKTGNRARP